MSPAGLRHHRLPERQPSVRVTDEFMEAVARDGEWRTRAVTGGGLVETYRARELFHKIAEAAHQCGDPGMQFDTTINAYHTCPTAGGFNASNPCSEYMFLDDSACQPGVVEPAQVPGHDGELDIEAVKHAIALSILAQEISSATRATDGQRSRRTRSPSARSASASRTWAPCSCRAVSPTTATPGGLWAAITALLTGHAYAHQRAHRPRRHRHLCRLRAEPGAVPGRDAEAPSARRPDRRRLRPYALMDAARAPGTRPSASVATMATATPR